MEDLWRIQDSAIEISDIADGAEYKRLLKRFRANEVNDNQRRLLYQENESTKKEGGGNQ